MKRTITVLQDDIDKGWRQDSEKCAIARAATRDLADLMASGDRVGVGSNVSIWKAGIYRTRWGGALSEEALHFMRNFDNYEPVEPFKFEINIRFNEED